VDTPDQERHDGEQNRDSDESCQSPNHRPAVWENDFSNAGATSDEESVESVDQPS
jgi:hypothetical protein